MAIDYVTTPVLRIAYEAGGPPDGPPVLLLHGWPDDARTYDRVAPALHAAGFRTIAPWLRGFGETAFTSPELMRSGQISALAQDAIDLADALGLSRFAVVGHDWGARTAYCLAATSPERLTRIAAMSVAWLPGALATPPLTQAQRFWYQWFMATERGAEVVRTDGKAFARFMWQTWGPTGWFDDASFAETARAFDNPDWPAVTLHGYRVRWEQAEPDPRHANREQRLQAAPSIATPTLVIHGAADAVVLVDPATDRSRLYFTGGYERHVLPGIGHFVTREAPDEVSPLLVDFLSADRG